MIVELTKENLLNLGCNEIDINKIIDSEINQAFNDFYISFTENKIYTDLDFNRKKYFQNGISFPIDCPDLIPEYYDLFLNSFLENQKKLLKSMFIETDKKEVFINNQMLAVKDKIDKNKGIILNFPQLDIYHKIDSIYYSYLKLLENKLKEVSNNIKHQKIEPLNSNITNLIHGTNKNGTVFFEYLIENYRQNEPSKVKFVNILHFLKNDADKKYFTFKVLQKNYNEIISKYDIEILKFAKSELYVEDERPILRSLETAFLKTLTP